MNVGERHRCPYRSSSMPGDRPCIGNTHRDGSEPSGFLDIPFVPEAMSADLRNLFHRFGCDGFRSPVNI